MPEAIAQLSNLTELYLYSNQITEIPEAIAQLSNLTTLDLENNKINEIPIALTQLSQLTKLDLRNNPLPISTEILGPPDVSQAPGSTNKIFRYLREMHSGEKRQLNEAKNFGPHRPGQASAKPPSSTASSTTNYKPPTIPNRRPHRQQLDRHRQHQTRPPTCIGTSAAKKFTTQPTNSSSPNAASTSSPATAAPAKDGKPPRILAQTHPKLRRQLTRHHRRQQMRRTTPRHQPQSPPRQIPQHQTHPRNLLRQQPRHLGSARKNHPRSLPTPRCLQPTPPLTWFQVKEQLEAMDSRLHQLPPIHQPLLPTKRHPRTKPRTTHRPPPQPRPSPQLSRTPHP